MASPPISFITFLNDIPGRQRPQCFLHAHIGQNPKNPVVAVTTPVSGDQVPDRQAGEAKKAARDHRRTAKAPRGPLPTWQILSIKHGNSSDSARDLGCSRLTEPPSRDFGSRGLRFFRRAIGVPSGPLLAYNAASATNRLKKRTCPSASSPKRSSTASPPAKWSSV